MQDGLIKLRFPRRNSALKPYYRAYQGALNLSQDRGYDLPEEGDFRLTAPTLNVTRFFRRFPASFEMVKSANEEVVRFEFWDVSLSHMPGKAGERLCARATEALKELRGVPAHMLRLIVFVRDYEPKQMQSERASMRSMDCRFEIFRYPFFEKVYRKHRLPKCEYAVATERNADGPLFPEVADGDWVSAYLGSKPGDVFRTEKDLPKHIEFRRVVPSAMQQPALPEKTDTSSFAQREVSLQVMRQLVSAEGAGLRTGMRTLFHAKSWQFHKKSLQLHKSSLLYHKKASLHHGKGGFHKKSLEFYKQALQFHEKALLFSKKTLVFFKKAFQCYNRSQLKEDQSYQLYKKRYVLHKKTLLSHKKSLQSHKETLAL